MNNDSSILPNDCNELQQIVRRYEHENDLLHQQVRLLIARLYGNKSEKGGSDSTVVQLPLFDMPEPEVEPEEKKEIEVLS